MQGPVTNLAAANKSLSNSRLAQRRYVPWLCLFSGLFIFRVVAQLIQKLSPVSILPDFSAWHSGTLPYSWLLFSQLLIIAAMAWVIIRFAAQTVLPNGRSGRVMLALGIIYFSVMLLRLVAGITFAAGHPWLGATIPSIFHLVLASFLIIVGHFHHKYG